MKDNIWNSDFAANQVAAQGEQSKSTSMALLESQREVTAEEWRLNDIKIIRQNWNAPLRHVQAQPKLEGLWGDKLKVLYSMLKKGMFVALIGTRGNGKTQLAVELMKCATWKLQKSLFTSAVEFFVALKSTYNRESSLTTEDVMQKYTSPSLLVIDEIGKRGDTEWENTILFELLNNRYNAMRDTVLIDNRSKADFIATIGPSLASRMNECGGIIECNWPSFRDSK